MYYGSPRRIKKSGEIQAVHCVFWPKYLYEPKNIIDGEKGKQKFKGKVHNWPTSSSVQSNISFSVPDKPRITQVANKTDTMLQFEWEHPNANGRLEGYKVRLFSVSWTWQLACDVLNPFSLKT